MDRNKEAYNFEDYPIKYWKNPNAEEKNVAYYAGITNWVIMTGYGETPEEALTDLKNKFNLYKEKNNTLPRPGEEVSLKFASSDKIWIYEKIAAEYFKSVLRLNFYDYIFTDYSYLSSLVPHDEADNDDYISKMKELIIKDTLEYYNIDISDIYDEPFWKVFERIEISSIMEISKTLEEAELQVKKNNFDKALQVMESLMQNIEKRSWYQNDEKCQYRCFDNILETLLYKEIFNPLIAVKPIPKIYSAVYSLYINILFELKQYNKAKEVLERANIINPLNVKIMFDLSEINKKNNEWEEYLCTNKKCLEYSYTNSDIARCYRNYGFYFNKQNEFDMATYLFYFSLDFEDNSIAHSELLGISEKTGKKIKQIKSEKIQEILKKNNIQVGANPVVLSVLFYMSKVSFNNDNMDGCKYFSEILYDLTKDEDIKRIIDFVNQTNGT